jgi:hypothetical protein
MSYGMWRVSHERVSDPVLDWLCIWLRHLDWAGPVIRCCPMKNGGWVITRYNGGSMGYKTKRTEHCGAKRGKGAYWGIKRDAKKGSNKHRRQIDKSEIQTCIK